MRRRLLVVAGLFGVAGSEVGAQVFNSGIPAGYTCTGTCSTSGANGDVTLAPGGGSQFGYVSTVGPVQNPLGIMNTTNGSTLRSSVFTSTAGQLLSFAFNYITSDGAGFSDYGFVRLFDTAMPGSPVTLFTARTTTAGNTVPGFGLPGLAPGVSLIPPATPIIPGAPSFAGLGADNNSCFAAGCGYTGWIGSQYSITATGSYQLEFGVFNIDDELYTSALAFDFTAGEGGTPNTPGTPDTPGTTVPEPGTWLLLASGLLATGIAARRRRA